MDELLAKTFKNSKKSTPTMASRSIDVFRTPSRMSDQTFGNNKTPMKSSVGSVGSGFAGFASGSVHSETVSPALGFSLPGLSAAKGSEISGDNKHCSGALVSKDDTKDDFTFSDADE